MVGSNIVRSNIVQKDQKKMELFLYSDSNMVGASNIVQRGPF